MSDYDLPIPDLDTQRLAELVFELAKQLHAERLQRMALATVLERSGVLPGGATADLLGDVEFRREARAAVEDSIARLMRVVTGQGDVRTPLRESNS
jgi:hypothetical protein